MPQNEWTKLPPYKHSSVGLAVIKGCLVAIGGYDQLFTLHKVTNVVISLLHEKNWTEVLPPMPTSRAEVASLTTSTHLVVAGGRKGDHSSCLDVVEVLDLASHQWSTAKPLPRRVGFSQMTLCDDHFYLCQDTNAFTCAVQDLLESCCGDVGSVWTRLADIPAGYCTSLVTLQDHVLVLGGMENWLSSNTTSAIHSYNQDADTWIDVGQLPTPLSRASTAVLSSNEIMVVQGNNVLFITAT